MCWTPRKEKEGREWDKGRKEWEGRERGREKQRGG